MFKNVVAPVQAWLLSQSRCVGCSMPLSQGKTEGDKIICKCGRIFIKDNGKFRRARFEEV
ncbi:MAG: hypothetical protein AAB768_00245 [Patescibacteria group bacterium]